MVFFSSCHEKCKPLSTTFSGTPLVDSTNDKRLFRLVHNTTTNTDYFAYYYANTVSVDTTHTPHTISVVAQAGTYDTSKQVWMLRNTMYTTTAYSSISMNTDTVAATYVGPFDPTTGQFYTKTGYLHYVNKFTGLDSTLCPISRIIYWNQNSFGQPVAIGFVSQQDLH